MTFLKENNNKSTFMRYDNQTASLLNNSYCFSTTTFDHTNETSSSISMIKSNTSPNSVFVHQNNNNYYNSRVNTGDIAESSGIYSESSSSEGTTSSITNITNNFLNDDISNHLDPSKELSPQK
jgi:hypothetical protein